MSEVLGEPVRHAGLTTDERAAHLTSAGYPAEFAAAPAVLDGHIGAGTQDMVTSVVADLSGRPPTTLRQYVAGNTERLRTATVRL